MNIKLAKYLAVLPMLFLLVACAQLDQLETQDTDSRKMVQDAKTHSDHNNLSNYYDNLAKEMAVKAAEEIESLKGYGEHSHSYGRQGQDFKSHTQANIRYYEQAASDATKQAEFHRKIAVELLQRDLAKSTEMPDQQNNRKIKARLNSGSENFIEEAIKTQ